MKQKLAEELNSMEQAFLLRWEKMKNASFLDVGPKRSNPETFLRYSAGRDCVNVFRFCFPLAGKLAGCLRPEWSKEGSAMEDVLLKYCTCFTEQEHQYELIGSAFPELLEDEEHAEAFAAFSAAYMAVQLAYMAFTPHLIQAFPHTWPELADKALDALFTASLSDDLEKREAILRQGMQAGFLPNSRKVMQLCRFACAGLLQDLLAKFWAGGCLIMEDDIDLDSLDLSDGVKERLRKLEGKART